MSQYNEISILNSYFGEKKDGVVVEIGAAFHDTNSNSKFLIERGWKALLVEPNRFFYNDLLKFYGSNNPNVHLENCCAFYKDIQEVKFYEYGQLSTMNEDFKNRVIEIGQSKDKWMDHNGEVQEGFIENKVKAYKTSKIIEKYFHYIDFLSIDCEGADFDVIKGLDFEKTHIQLICHEKQNDSSLNKEIQDYLYSFGFKYYISNIGNVFYEKIN